MDDLVVNTPNLSMGDNQVGSFYRNANFGRDFDIPETADIAQLNEGDVCRGCGAPLESYSAIELGNIFKLDDFYTRKMNFSYTDNKGRKLFPFMGVLRYGTGKAAELYRRGKQR